MSNAAGRVRRAARVRTLRGLSVLAAALVAAGLGAVAVQPAATAAGDQTLLPVADAGVYSGAASTNYGKSTTARVDDSATVHRPWYLRFPAATVPAGEVVTGAKLRFYTTALPSGYARGPAVKVENTSSSWGETTITWANRPGAVRTITGSAPAGPVGGYTEVPLTGYTGGAVSLLVTATDTGSAHIFSRESTAGHPPELVVTTGSDYRLVWSDEFNGTAVDTTKWTVRNNWKAANESSVATSRSKNVFVANGRLTIRSLRETYTAGTETRQYTSGYLDTDKKRSWTYGRFSIRAKLPTQQGTSKGIWPAFWMRPLDTLDGEIDILEALGSGSGGTEWNKARQAIHHDYRGDQPQQSSTYTFPTGQPSDGFHTYTVDWEPGRLTWLIDGRPVWQRDRTTTPWFDEVFARPYTLRLNQQVGCAPTVASCWGGLLSQPDASTVFPADYVIDWVRVYQKP